ncbi:hypothetical protein [Paucibacter soli]|uniref:hypothetical protein n=1 Tax=Paucibacter soli TaxID=3133433 RepID=UPI0030B17FC9
MIQREIANLAPALIGGLVAIAQRLLASEPMVESPRLGLDEAKAVLQMRGMPYTEACGSVDALCALGLLREDESGLRIASIDMVLSEQLAQVANRSKGWVKRTSESGLASKALAAAPDRANVVSAPAPAPASAPAATADTIAPAESGHLPGIPPATAPVAAPAATPARKLSGSVLVRRFGINDKIEPGDDDPTMVRIACEGDRTAEIAKSLVDHLQVTFKSLDVEQQLRMAALWCESNKARQKTFTGLRRFINSWLSNASRDADVRQAVVRAGKTGNGFGQGGSYGGPEADHQAGSSTPFGDDLSDLDGLETDLKPATSAATQVAAIPQAAPSAVRPSAAMLARGSRTSAPAWRASGAQRRLSDQFGRK